MSTKHPPVFAVLEDWESGKEMTRSMADIVAERIDELMDSELGQIHDLINSDPYAAFARLTRLTSFLSVASTKLPIILGRLPQWVGRIRAAVEALARKTRADSFSIGVSAPWGISIDLSWDV